MTRPAFLALAMVLGMASSVHADTSFTTRSRKLMGTRFTISALATTAAQRQAIDAALEHVAALEKRWSPWVSGSALQRINDQAGGKAVKVAASTLALIQRSVALCKTTGRAFDPTFFALKPLYDFRAKPFVPPTTAAIEGLLPLVDCRRLVVNAKRQTVRLTHAGMKLHLGGNAKGTALDEAAAVLRAAGLTRFYVDGGGDLVAGGEGPKGPWRVGLQNPRGKRSDLMGLVQVVDGAVATSGDYERFAVVGGKRYHHIVDPRTGRPATGCMSATVVVPKQPHMGELADGLATMLCVLGPKVGFPLLKLAKGAQAAMITQAGKLHRTPGFQGRLALPKALAK